MGPFERIARRFLQDGWRVALIQRDTSRAIPLFRADEVESYQAPFKATATEWRKTIAYGASRGTHLRKDTWPNHAENRTPRLTPQPPPSILVSAFGHSTLNSERTVVSRQPTSPHEQKSETRQHISEVLIDPCL
jgi:hypothetical protein